MKKYWRIITLLICLALSFSALVYVRLVNPCKDAASCNLVCYNALYKNQNGLALKFCSLAIKKDPSFTWPYSNRANAKTAKGDFLGAIEDASKAISLDPSYANAYNNRGTAKKALGDYKGALLDYEKAIELDPKKFDPYHNKALTYQDMREFVLMQSAAQQYISLFPKKADAYRLSAQARKMLSNYFGAMNDYKSAFNISKDKTDMYNAARAEAVLGRWAEACVYLKQNGGDCGFTIDQMRRDIEDANAVLQRKPTDLHSLTKLLDIYKFLGDTKREIDTYTRLIDITDSYIYYNERGWTRAMSADYKAALLDAEEAISRAPYDANIGYIYDTRAVAKYGLGDLKGALTDHNTAIEMDPYHELYKNRAITKAALGDYKGAQADMQKALF